MNLEVSEFTCLGSDTVLKALNVLNTSGKRIVFVTDSDRKLTGVLTDGDVRRALMRGHSLDGSVDSIAKKDFVVGHTSETSDQIFAKFSDAVKIIPIVDENGRLASYVQFESDVHVPIASPNLAGNELKYVTEAMLSTWVSSKGRYIERFESCFAGYCDAKHGVATSNGTTALQLAMAALGIGPGDEVILPDLTFAASINSVIHLGATPVIVDVEKDSWCISPAAIREAITENTKAIMPVHIYGQAADMQSIMEIAQEHKLFVVEDAAEAHGATFNGQRVGSFGDIACFSFFANKIVTTGEGGMCLTNDEAIAEKLRMLRDHGQSRTKPYWHEVIGFNFRMTNLQAAIGCAQMERIGDIQSSRKSLEAKYHAVLEELPFFEIQRTLPGRERVVWLVTALLKNPDHREEFILTMKEASVDVRNFFYPLSEMDIYKKYSHKDCPVTREIAYRGVCFPTGENVPLERFADTLRSFCSSHS